MKTLPLFLLGILVGLVSSSFGGALLVNDSVSGSGAFPLVENLSGAAILISKDDAEVVRTAAGMLAGDVELVSGVRLRITNSVDGDKGPLVVVGTVESTFISDLAQRGKINLSGIIGKWETFSIQTVDNPFPRISSALVIAGSDRRGAAYGCVTVSEAIGISPWVWWADVAAPRRTNLWVSGSSIEGPPSVKYRGIFINDEDWGLQPWAAKTFEPEVGDIGPKTYEKICELLLRLKANYLWPAMHDCTKAFNSHPENKKVADRYAIVMGSSHAEPMLRNNVSEWPKDQKDKWNPVTNLEGILEYWEKRVRENSPYENVYTVGMRGIHDGGMPGGGSIEEKRDRLEKIIGLQRGLLAKYINPDPGKIPQIFCPYKEVLELYQSGMRVPDDVTIIWPDDNYGYIRQLPGPQERLRSGGHGIYYHLSYWGRPHDYLWLDSTSPALIWHEMNKAYELGAQRLWVANIGDIKPMETGMTFFLAMAWDNKRYGTDVQKKFLRDFYTVQFGEKYADRIADLKDEYYRLCAIRRPEHMGFNRVQPNTPIQGSEWSQMAGNDEAESLLARWLELAKHSEAFATELPTASQDAYFQLVEYPACAGAAMAQKLICAEKARLTGSKDFAREANRALQRIGQLSARYNAQAKGKWDGIMNDQPRKLPVFGMPPTEGSSASPAVSLPAPPGQVVINASDFIRSEGRNGLAWQAIAGLGPRGASVTVLPQRDVPTLRSSHDIRNNAPRAEYRVENRRVGEMEIKIEALPTYPLTPAHELIIAVSVDKNDPVFVRFEQGKDKEKDPVWQRNVLRNIMTGSATLHVPSQPFTLKLWAADVGMVVQRILLTPMSTE